VIFDAVKGDVCLCCIYVSILMLSDSVHTAQCLNWPDDWTATTVDGKRTAQFEHTLLISKEGVEALTGKIETSPIQFWEKESKVNKGIWLGNTPAARARAAELSSKVE